MTQQHAKSSFTVLDLVVGVLILCIGLFLMVNCVILAMAQEYNRSICKESIALAATAAQEGRSTLEVHKAAYRAMDRCGIGGFFVRQPTLSIFADEISPELRTITIATTTSTMVPAPFLIADRSVIDGNSSLINVRSSCVFKLSNPKNCQGSHIFLGPDGKVSPVFLQKHPEIKPQINPSVKK